MKLTDKQLQILRDIQNGKFGSVDRDWGFLKKHGYIDFDATDDGIITKDPVLTSFGLEALVVKRNDFSPEQIKVCQTLDGFASQIQDLGKSIRRDRKELDHDHPLSNYLASLEDIVFSFSEIYGGYWLDVTNYPTFDSFTEQNTKYLKDVLRPSLYKLKKVKVPESGEPGSGMSSQFLSYLDRVENISHLLLNNLNKEKRFSLKNLIEAVKKEWKWIIGVFITVVGTILIPLFLNASSKESLNNIQNSNLTQSPVVAGNVGAINYNTPIQASYLNERSEETNINDAEDLIKYYFESYNRNKFQEACSLLKKIKCDAADSASIQDFSRFADKLSNGYENVQVKELSNLAKKDAVVCVKYSYELKTDPTPSKISEIFSYYVADREDSYKEITSRVCEKKHDSVLGDRPCPIEAEKKYCLNVF